PARDRGLEKRRAGRPRPPRRRAPAANRARAARSRRPGRLARARRSSGPAARAARGAPRRADRAPVGSGAAGAAPAGSHLWRGWPPDETTAVSKWRTEILLVGAGGEPVDLGRTLLSHGFVELPPMRLDEDLPALELTLAVNSTARTAEIRAGKRGHARVTVLG